MKSFPVAAVLGIALLMISSPFADAASRLVARVEISTQTMTVLQDGEVVDTWRVSTAGRGYRTPTGVYRPTSLHKMWYSKKYHMSPMPYSIFFRGGYAIHGTDSVRRLGTPASHGCVRLHPSHAAKLYAMVRRAGAGNTSIHITR